MPRRSGSRHREEAVEAGAVLLREDLAARRSRETVDKRVGVADPAGEQVAGPAFEETALLEEARGNARVREIAPR